MESHLLLLLLLDLSILPDTGNRSNAISLKAVTSFRLSTRNKNVGLGGVH